MRAVERAQALAEAQRSAEIGQRIGRGPVVVSSSSSAGVVVVFRSVLVAFLFSLGGYLSLSLSLSLPLSLSPSLSLSFLPPLLPEPPSHLISSLPLPPT